MSFATPEAAFEEYRDAWTHKDMRRLFAVTDFGPSPALAAENEAFLRTHLETRGFIPTFDECEVVTVLRDSDTQVRFLINRRILNGEILVPMRVMRFAEGWRVIYGG